MAQEDAQDPQGNGPAHGRRHREPDPDSGELAVTDDLGALSHSDESRLGGGGGEPDEEAKYQEPKGGALAHELIGQAFAQGEDAHLQSLDENGEADAHEQDPKYHISGVGRHLLQEEDLKREDDRHNGQEIAEGVPQAAEERL